MLRDLIGKHVRVIDKHSARYGQVGTIIGIQPDHDEVDLDDPPWMSEKIELDPNAEIDWAESDELGDEPAANQGLRTVIVCFGDETAMLYEELEVLDRGPKQKPEPPKAE